MMKNLEYCKYTYRHRRALEYLVNKLIKSEDEKNIMLKRIKKHDMDKMLMYQFLDKKEASTLHRQHATHHIENDKNRCYFDNLETILDYESAGYTKPDKPLNAYDTILKYKADKISSDLLDDLMKILKEFGMNKSYSVTEDKDGMEYLSQFDEVTEEMIHEELLDYILER